MATSALLAGRLCRVSVRFGLRHAAARQDVGQALDISSRDDVLAGLVLLAKAVDQLGAEDVDLPVQDAPLVGDVHLLFGQLLDEVLELLVRQRAEIGEGVHGREHTGNQAQVEAWRTYCTVAPSVIARPM